MAITINIYYMGKNGNAKKFAEEMISSGIVDKIRKEEGNLRYEYFFPMDDEETVLLIDSWENQKAIDLHHQTSMMQEIIALREKYDLRMKVERYTSEDLPENDKHFIRNS
jgi:quinol monooxygenase YgiN